MPLDLNALFGDITRRNASDLHLSVGNPPVMRFDGRLLYLKEMKILQDEDIEHVLSSILSPMQMKKYQTTHELDFSFAYKRADGKEDRFRGNAYYSLSKMSVAFRLIPPVIRTIDDLNLPPILKDVSKKRRGLFLVTGPTGHGKSTTLAAIVREINHTREDHIITIEDPVEFVHSTVRCLINQREIGTDTMSFAEGLKRAMRQDPDVILIGEMRDLETISAAVTAAETGHLVFGTLHTQDAAQSIDRLVDVFPTNQQEQIRVQLAAVLVGVCSQQLIPKGDGSGDSRICATEVLISNPAVRNCVREGKTSQIKTLIQTGVHLGMHTMEQCLATFVQNGMLPREAAFTYAYDTKELQRILGK